MLSSLPPGACEQPNITPDCTRWVIAPGGEGLACDAFVISVWNFVPFFTESLFLTWNPAVTITEPAVNITDNCSGFLGDYAYCVEGNTSNLPDVTNPLGSIGRRDSDRSRSDIHGRNLLTNPVNLTTNLTTADLPNLDVNFTNPSYWSTPYSMSPFISWSSYVVNSSISTKPIDSSDQSQWPGIYNVSEDVQNLLSNAYISESNGSVWDGLTISSPDWLPLNFSECLHTFSTRYRSYTGTVVMVVNYNHPNNHVLGLTYLSYNATSLAQVCPKAFLDDNGGSKIISIEKPPQYPLIFGTFKDQQSYEICPKNFKNMSSYRPTDIPTVQGCLLRTRGSQCRLGYNVPFFFIVIGCLVIKIFLLLLALMVVKERPILTVGDAVASYLDVEDESTKGCSLQWTRKRKWFIERGPLSTYTARSQLDKAIQSQPRKKSENESKQETTIRIWEDMRRQWKEVWPSKGDARYDAVPKWDIINYSNTMRSQEKIYWLMFYFSTLGVAAGVFTYIHARQTGWIVFPEPGHKG